MHARSQIYNHVLPSFSSNSKKLEIAYSVNWKDPWEPFYIGPIHVPLYDERFKQVSNSQIASMKLHVPQTRIDLMDYNRSTYPFLA